MKLKLEELKDRLVRATVGKGFMDMVRINLAWWMWLEKKTGEDPHINLFNSNLKRSSRWQKEIDDILRSN